MKRFVLPLLCLLISSISVAQNQRLVKGLVQDEDGFGLVGASITSPGETATAVTGQGGAFEIRVSPYAKKIVATHEGYLSGEAEIDGSMIILRLKVDKKYAEKKAKADAEAARAAKAEAERLAKEQAKANKAKEQSKTTIATSVDVLQDAALKDKSSRKAEKIVREFSRRTTGYEQYLDLSLRTGGFTTGGLNYIGGYRFNQHLFLGVGAGLDLYLNDGLETECFYSGGVSVEDQPEGITFPLYVNLRVNFSKKRWSPYVSILTGCRLSTVEYWSLSTARDAITTANVAMSSVDFGMNKALKKGKTMYFGIGLAIEGYGCSYYYKYTDSSLYYKDGPRPDSKEGMGATAALKFNLGFSF